MNPRVVVKSLQQRILASIASLCEAAQESEKKEVSSTTLETTVVELVRDIMRDMARRDDFGLREDTLLDAAIRQARAALDKRLALSEHAFDLSPMLDAAARSLKQTAEELRDLSSRLAESKRRRRLKQEVVGESVTSRSFTVHQIGLEGYPTGLLASPASCESVTLDFEALQRDHGFEVIGDPFPVELAYESHVFVIDDDGSVFVSVDGLPIASVARVDCLLREIARTLYA